MAIAQSRLTVSIHSKHFSIRYLLDFKISQENPAPQNDMPSREKNKEHHQVQKREAAISKAEQDNAASPFMLQLTAQTQSRSQTSLSHTAFQH